MKLHHFLTRGRDSYARRNQSIPGPAWALAAGLVFFTASAAQAQWRDQDLNLTAGWNGVYLQVQPEDASCEAVFAGWPVDHVSLYNMEDAYAEFTSNPDEPLNPTQAYLTWRPGQPAGANSLVSVRGGHSYLIYANEAFSASITGRPVVPRIEWIRSDQLENLVGFRAAETATFRDYLGSAPFYDDGLSLYTVGGTNSLSIEYFPLGFGGGFGSVVINPDTAYLATCPQASDFCGPLRVSPAGTTGLRFGTEESYGSFTVKNESGGDLAVTIALDESAAAPTGPTPEKPTLLYFDVFDGWQPLADGCVLNLNTGETHTIQVALDRTEMTDGTVYGAVLVCSDDRGGRVEMPVEAEFGPPDDAHALWPAGLWVGKAVLSEVTQVLPDGSLRDGVPVSKELAYRLILHVGTDGSCRMLQRVLVAGFENEEGEWQHGLYREESAVPPGAQAVRVSSVAFSTRNDISTVEEDGFGDHLAFVHVVAADDPVNPFRHAYHPDHDGLAADFETPLPPGDDPLAYAGTVKPETFSLTNRLEMTWEDDEGAEHPAIWNPASTVTGRFSHRIEGLRREGPIQMNGRFSLQRISQVGTLEE